jgi:hypothetical protein
MWYSVLISILLLLIFAVIGGLMEIRTREKYGDVAGTMLFFGNFYGMITMTVILVSIFVMNSRLTPKEPEAIDVYRNNTELKIQHVIENGDTIQSDTTIVFKNI